ncbi:uncharacterized protein G2W53_003930 [Senna tora]|uniref:Uncharacterized protein n=1 Tax=Senna tora TaxID=362788 RepID=A0A834XBG6_9FABA|nr:uncharacterized protein G2W53_003930 [Senna tora]
MVKLKTPNINISSLHHHGVRVKLRLNDFLLSTLEMGLVHLPRDCASSPCGGLSEFAKRLCLIAMVRLQSPMVGLVHLPKGCASSPCPFFGNPPAYVAHRHPLVTKLGCNPNPVKYVDYDLLVMVPIAVFPYHNVTITIDMSYNVASKNPNYSSDVQKAGSFHPKEQNPSGVAQESLEEHTINVIASGQQPNLSQKIKKECNRCRRLFLLQTESSSKSHLLELGERPVATMNQGKGKHCGSKFTTATLDCYSLFITKEVVAETLTNLSPDCNKFTFLA